MDHREVIEVAQRLCAPGKGILAADESTGTIGKRLAHVGIANTETMRRDYRELFLTAPNLSASISGAILYHETLGQSASDGIPFVDHLTRRGVLPGVKVDQGLAPLQGDGAQPGETHTLGLADVEAFGATCLAYRQQGARFAKWRAALPVTQDGSCPSPTCRRVNAEELARYARHAQAAGLVPIVEPELLIEGDYSAARAEEAATQVVQETVQALWAQGVVLEGCLLKPQMVIAGLGWTNTHTHMDTGGGGGDRKNADQPQDQDPSREVTRGEEKEIEEEIEEKENEVATRTLRMLRRSVPAAIPGVMFLSGGQSEAEATTNLDALNVVKNQRGGAPWALSFSFGRALQATVLRMWSATGGTPSAAQKAEIQDMVGRVARANGLATVGRWAEAGEEHPAQNTGRLVETFRGRTSSSPS